MSHINPRTGRYADDFFEKLNNGTATVGDLVAHAQEIIVESPEVWGAVVVKPVQQLLMVIDLLSAGEPVHQHDKLRDLELGLRS